MLAECGVTLNQAAPRHKLASFRARQGNGKRRPDMWTWQSPGPSPFTAGLGTNWVTVTSADATNLLFISIAPANGNLFFRLAQP
jgi:hypothetical protein